MPLMKLREIVRSHQPDKFLPLALAEDNPDCVNRVLGLIYRFKARDFDAGIGGYFLTKPDTLLKSGQTGCVF